jgi:hypothetical protein
MALLSQVDWIILLGVAAFILLGRGNTQLLRQLGRWYARAIRLKQELLSEFRVAADLPRLSPGSSSSIRSTLLSWEPMELSSSRPGPEISAATADFGTGSLGLARTSWTVSQSHDNRASGGES